MIKPSHRPLALLLSLVFLLLAYGIMNETETASVVLLIMLFVVLISATLQLAETRKRRWPAYILVFPTFICFVISRITHTRGIGVLAFAFLAVFFLYTVVRLLLTILRRGAISREDIYLALSVYMLLGYSWFAIFSVVEGLIPGSFRSTVNEAGYMLTSGDRIYYSFETLTTLGFGDILPVKPLARILTVLESSMGVLYVGVLVARLVSSYAEVKKT
jgi:voltage-gated potassium channel